MRQNNIYNPTQPEYSSLVLDQSGYPAVGIWNMTDLLNSENNLSSCAGPLGLGSSLKQP